MHDTYLLLPQLRLQDVCGVGGRCHPVQARLHPLQPDVRLLPLGLVPLGVGQHGVQLGLALHHLAVGLFPVLAKFCH